MNYQDDFFQKYQPYLEIPAVRTAHDRLLRVACSELNLSAGVTDMGCGTAEFARFLKNYHTCNYLGIDLDISRVDTNIDNHTTFQVGDYTKVLPRLGNVVVSLFATEIHLPWDEHEALYQKWFRECNTPAILVSGFYYEKCPNEAMIVEHTGYKVYQTTVNTPLTPGELRLTQKVPAGMFVDPFVEVWRILTPETVS